MSTTHEIEVSRLPEVRDAVEGYVYVVVIDGLYYGRFEKAVVWTGESCWIEAVDTPAAETRRAELRRAGEPMKPREVAGVGTACIEGDRKALSKALRELRKQSRELARAGRAWAIWVGWPSEKGLYWP